MNLTAFVPRHKLISLTAYCLLVALPAVAAPRKKASRTLKELIALTEKSGQQDSIEPPLCTNLGFESAPKGKTLSYDASKTLDHKGHDFTVIREGKKIKALVWSATADSGSEVDGSTFRSSADGSLIAAVSARGKKGEIVQTKLDVKEAAAVFDSEKRFFLHEAAGLEPDK